MTRPAPVLILTAFRQRELVVGAAQTGAIAYLVQPFQKADVVPAIELAAVRYQERGALEGEVEDLKERLETRKLVDRAKGTLVDRYGMKEADAFRSLQKAAMDGRLGWPRWRSGWSTRGRGPDGCPCRLET